VAAHLDPEILLVDEVLAVGDPTFQKKCLGKMEDVARGGRTVLFVSHNMGAVVRLVQTARYLDGGRIVAVGPARQVVDQYLSAGFPLETRISYPEDPGKQTQILEVTVMNAKLEPTARFAVRATMRQMSVAFMIELTDGTAIPRSSSAHDSGMHETWSVGIHRVQAVFPGGVLNCGQYLVRPGLGRSDGSLLDYHPADGLGFEPADASEAETLGVGLKKKRGLLLLTPEYRSIPAEPSPRPS
jgi:lipopolysaccharide transport system ATP-binding protein